MLLKLLNYRSLLGNYIFQLKMCNSVGMFLVGATVSFCVIQEMYFYFHKFYIYYKYFHSFT